MKTTAQKRKEAREARAADPYAYQRSKEQKAQRRQRPRRPAPMYTKHHDVVVEEARARLYEYVDKHPGQMDHDRDILLLKIFDILEGLKEAACPFTSGDGWLMCQLKKGHSGSCQMKDISVTKAKS
jgi:hypothetical protein